MFSMVPVITAEMVPPSKYPLYSSIVSVAMALSFLLGPLLGGAISDGTTWRWIFYINLPTAAIGLGLIYLAMPAAFPDLASPRSLLCAPKRVNFLTQVDYPGFVALLAASVLLIVAIEEAGIAFSWDSAVVVVFLVLAGVFFLLFLGWEWSIHRRGDPNTTAQKSVFPWEFVTNRVFMGACLTALLSGIPYTTLVLILPGRFQNLNHDSGLDAGVHLLPYTLAIAIGSSLSGVLARGRVVPILVFLAAAILQVLGTGLLYSIRPDTSIPARLFGFLLLAGLGVGLSMNTAMLIVPSVVGGKNLSVALGSITQLRILGGALGVSIATTLLNNTLRTSLQPHLPAGAVEVLMQDVASAKMLSAMEQSLVQTALADGYQRQLAMVFGFLAAQLGAVGLLWERTVRRLE
ncbi:hypothetical protein BJX61DRAFT_494426 [Aspergillus egyptiacus]|nr:hypothetical protein BJX61DRAFT_494426 [Aspergillus egyptiacus]